MSDCAVREVMSLAEEETSNFTEDETSTTSDDGSVEIDAPLPPLTRRACVCNSKIVLRWRKYKGYDGAWGRCARCNGWCKMLYFYYNKK